MSDYEVLEVPNVLLQRGGLLPMARLAYKTLGTLSPARDNAVLVPTWYTGTHNDIETFMVGEGRALDPRKYFIVMTNLLGNGLSSSPSNSPPPNERGRFPKVTIHDNVRLQQLLLTQKLGLARIRLVTGWSMGACQTFEWAAQFPDMVRAACPIAGSARTASYNKVFLLALQRALELDPVFASGFYDRPPVEGLKAFASILRGLGNVGAFLPHGGLPRLRRARLPGARRLFLGAILRALRRVQLSRSYGPGCTAISATILPIAATSRPRLARSKHAPSSRRWITIAIFRPDSEYEAQHIPGAKCRVISSIWGHMAPMNPRDIPAIDGVLHELLAD